MITASKIPDEFWENGNVKFSKISMIRNSNSWLNLQLFQIRFQIRFQIKTVHFNTSQFICESLSAAYESSM